MEWGKGNLKKDGVGKKDRKDRSVFVCVLKIEGKIGAVGCMIDRSGVQLEYFVLRQELVGQVI